MVNVTFLSPEVFNVLKYIVLSLTVSAAAEALFNTVHAYSASTRLLQKGYVYPSGAPVRMRVRRGIKLVSVRDRWLLSTVLAAICLEIVLESSTGATSTWTTRSDIFRMSQQASSMEQVSQSGIEFLKRMSNVLERVEGTCYSIKEEWYSPVMLNLTNSSTVFASGRAAWCLQNYTLKINATHDIEQSSFQASDVVQMNVWNASQLRVGGHSEYSEQSVSYEQVGDVRIGVHEKYSYLAVNFTDKSFVRGSTRVLSGNDTRKNPTAFFTANFRTENNVTLECLGFAKFFKDETGEAWPVIKPWPEACLVPLRDGRMILAMFDDYDGIPNAFQLVMSVALKDVKSFHDLRVLRALPWMIKPNEVGHSYRELGALAVLCFRMISGICTNGLRDIRLEFGDRNVTVPTWSWWGMVLLAIGVLVILAVNGILRRERKKLTLDAELTTARGVAEQWLLQQEHFDEGRGTGRVVLVADSIAEGDWAIVAVIREEE